MVASDELKRLAAILADWAEGMNVTIYLHGSRVRGDQRPDSDVDVLVEFGPSAVSTETAQWWDKNNAEDFAALQARLPGRLHMADAMHFDLPTMVKCGEDVYRDRNVRCMLLPSAKSRS